MTIPKIFLVFYLITASHSLAAQVTPEVQKESESKTYTKIDEMPVFPYDLRAYVYLHLNYPVSAKINKIEGKVIASFVVQKDGSIKKVKIVKGIGGGCDEEVIRMIEGMPAWKPGKHNGKRVKVLFKLPVVFKLDK